MNIFYTLCCFYDVFNREIISNFDEEINSEETLLRHQFTCEDDEFGFCCSANDSKVKNQDHNNQHVDEDIEVNDDKVNEIFKNVFSEKLNLLHTQVPTKKSHRRMK